MKKILFYLTQTYFGHKFCFAFESKSDLKEFSENNWININYEEFLIQEPTENIEKVEEYFDKLLPDQA
jgi:hypothetical protein